MLRSHHRGFGVYSLGMEPSEVGSESVEGGGGGDGFLGVCRVFSLCKTL